MEADNLHGNTSGVKAVIFDFGGVLCFPPTDDQIARAAAACGIDVPRFLEAFWKIRPEYDRGTLGPHDYWTAFAKMTGRKFDREHIEEMVRREIDFWSAYDERVLAWARELRTQGFRLGILSNLPSPLGKHLRIRPWFLDHFDQVTFSYELLLMKPEAEIYQRAIAGLGIRPSEALFLDDRPENVVGARAAGLQAVLFESWARFVERDLGRYGLPRPGTGG